MRGITSNPTIFAKAISGHDIYDEQFRTLVGDHTVEAAYWEMAMTDIGDALGLLSPLYDESDREDGYVSLEVSPALAHDTEGTVRDARMLHGRVDQPNLLVKVPATREGIPAIEHLIGEGRSINVTLIFGLDRYDAVMEAYLRGLEALVAAGRETELGAGRQRGLLLRQPGRHRGRPASGAPGRRRERRRRRARFAGNRRGGPGADRLRALPAAPSRVARWEALRAKGARVQRPLWASTSTKNPAYPDLLYVDSLIGPATVNTMPERHAAGVRGPRHAEADRRRTTPTPAAATLARLAEAGIDMDDVEQTLEDEGVHSFAKSFDELLQLAHRQGGYVLTAAFSSGTHE